MVLIGKDDNNNKQYTNGETNPLLLVHIRHIPVILISMICVNILHSFLRITKISRSLSSYRQLILSSSGIYKLH